jgi:hypothetical protein
LTSASGAIILFSPNAGLEGVSENFIHSTGAALSGSSGSFEVETVVAIEGNGSKGEDNRSPPSAEATTTTKGNLDMAADAEDDEHGDNDEGKLLGEEVASEPIPTSGGGLSLAAGPSLASSSGAIILFSPNAGLEGVSGGIMLETVTQRSGTGGSDEDNRAPLTTKGNLNMAAVAEDQEHGDSHESSYSLSLYRSPSSSEEGATTSGSVASSSPERVLEEGEEAASEETPTSGGLLSLANKKGYAKRHRLVLRDKTKGISKPTIRLLARRGGVKRIPGFIYKSPVIIGEEIVVEWDGPANGKIVSAYRSRDRRNLGWFNVEFEDGVRGVCHLESTRLHPTGMLHWSRVSSRGLIVPVIEEETVATSDLPAPTVSPICPPPPTLPLENDNDSDNDSTDLSSQSIDDIFRNTSAGPHPHPHGPTLTPTLP